MKKTKFVWFPFIVIFFLIQPTLFAGKKPISKGDTFPEIKLPMPEDPSHQKYLGLSDKGPFRVQDIKSDVVLVQVFSST